MNHIGFPNFNIRGGEPSKCLNNIFFILSRLQRYARQQRQTQLLGLAQHCGQESLFPSTLLWTSFIILIMNLLKPIISSALTIFILAWAIPTIAYADWVTLIIAAIVLVLLQKLVKPVLNLLFLPINIVTLGFFSLVITVFILWLATYLVPGFAIEATTVAGIELNQFFTLLLVSFLIGFLQSLIGFVL